MKVLVIGAAGRSGEAVVNEALAAGHKVTAFVRSAAQYNKANVRIVAGDVLDAAAVDPAVFGQDAVIDALGGKTPWKVTTMETAAAHNIVGAMRRHGVRRLLKISVVGAGDSVRNAGFFNKHLLMKTFLRGLLVDKAGMEAEIEASNLDWTLVRPPMLTDHEKTGVARVLSTEGGEKAHKIGRADLAAFMVQQLENSRYVRQAVTVTTT
ncbi:MAG: SDR family oxidoreductase [Acidobacteriota bacterium]|jgi:putative NADH-flavin reductase|nr:SDR family oxidoreductase [Acidobacteriota bacterium]